MLLSWTNYSIEFRCSENPLKGKGEDIRWKVKTLFTPRLFLSGQPPAILNVIWRAVYSYSVSRFGADYKPQGLALEQKIKKQSVFLGVV